VYTISFALFLQWQNLRSPAKRLTEQNSNLSALVIDLRGHGQSSEREMSKYDTQSPHTIKNCAFDVMQTLQTLNLTGTQSPVGIVGHSLGGRIALQYTHALMIKDPMSKTLESFGSEDKSLIYPPQHTWLLDTVPGKAHGSVSNVIHAVSNVSMPVTSKKDLVNILTKEKNVELAIAQWMTTNLRKSKCGQGFEFIFDLEVAKAILEDFSSQEFMQLVDECLSLSLKSEDGKHFHLVMGGKNEAWTKSVVDDLDKLRTKFSRLNLVSLPKAGHWVHVDDLDGLMSAMENAFAS
jgi:pimeloyl-ACP methyl ester carboxylesterase